MTVMKTHFIEQLDSKFLSKLAGMFGTEHELLGASLRVSIVDVVHILRDHNQAVTRTLKILQKWMGTSDKLGDLSAMYDELCSAFSDLDRNDIAEFIRRSKWTLVTRLNKY